MTQEEMEIVVKWYERWLWGDDVPKDVWTRSAARCLAMHNDYQCVENPKYGNPEYAAKK